MRFKTDENVPEDAALWLRDAGHDALSVHAQVLGGIQDPDLLQVCVREGRCLVTFDLDFADIVRNPPAQSAGIIVLRLRSQDLRSVRSAIRRLADLLQQEAPERQLWIVEDARVRIWDATDA